MYATYAGKRVIHRVVFVCAQARAVCCMYIVEWCACGVRSVCVLFMCGLFIRRCLVVCALCIRVCVCARVPACTDEIAHAQRIVVT